MYPIDDDDTTLRSVHHHIMVDMWWRAKVELRGKLDDLIQDAVWDCLSRPVSGSVRALIIHHVQGIIYRYFKAMPTSEEEAGKPMRKLDSESKRHIRNVAKSEVDKMLRATSDRCNFSDAINAKDST